MAMLHRSSEQNGQSQMQHVGTVTLAPQGTVRFAPRGYHLMLMGAKHPLAVGERVPVTLRFSAGSSVTVEFVVRPAGATGPYTRTRSSACRSDERHEGKKCVSMCISWGVPHD